MSIDWRLKVYDATFTDRTQPGVANNIITSSMGVASLDTFDVDSTGNCLEARFRAVPAFVDIQPRDVIILEISTDSGSTWTAKYRGYVVTCGNPRSKSIQPYKLVGLKQRFLEKINRLDEVGSQSPTDVATFAIAVWQSLVDNSDMPAGVSTSTYDIPDTNFDFAVLRWPKWEPIADTFDYLVESVGRFIVPTGSTYTYDGTTYSAGDVVPAVQWGVGADGILFFRRAQEASLSVSELDAGVFVGYDDISAESIADQIGLVYASTVYTESRVDTGLLSYQPSLEAVTRPIVRFFDFSGGSLAPASSYQGDKATVFQAASDPLSIMSNVADTTTIISGSPSNVGNIIDGDRNTFASFTSFARVNVTSSSVSIDGETKGFIVYVKAEATADGADFGITSGRPYTYEWNDLTNGDEIELILNILPLNSQRDSGIDTVAVTGSDMDVFEVEIYVPLIDVTPSGGTLDEQYAQHFVRQPTLDVATIRQVGTLGAVTQTIDFTPNGESARDVPVERISYALTTREGLVTTYHAGQAYDAELLSERAVLEALAKRATR